MGNEMVKEHTLTIVETSMWEVGRMGNEVVKEQRLSLREENMLGNTRMGNSGTEYFMKITETSLESGRTENI